MNKTYEIRYVTGEDQIGNCKIIKRDGREVFCHVKRVKRVNIGSDDEPRTGFIGVGPEVTEPVGRAIARLWRANRAVASAKLAVKANRGMDDIRAGELLPTLEADAIAAEKEVVEAEAALKAAKKA